jgi:hypothetical protein
MEGLVLCAALVAILVGLGRWWKPPAPSAGDQSGSERLHHGWGGQYQPIPPGGGEVGGKPMVTPHRRHSQGCRTVVVLT